MGRGLLSTVPVSKVRIAECDAQYFMEPHLESKGSSFRQEAASLVFRVRLHEIWQCRCAACPFDTTLCKTSASKINAGKITVSELSPAELPHPKNSSSTPKHLTR